MIHVSALLLIFFSIADHSEDHILDALLKTKLINKHSRKVCVPLLRKILSELVVRRPLAELTYVRFLLSFKLWKNIVADVEERRAINKLAAQRLHPPPEYFQVDWLSIFSYFSHSHDSLLMSLSFSGRIMKWLNQMPRFYQEFQRQRKTGLCFILEPNLA